MEDTLKNVATKLDQLQYPDIQLQYQDYQIVAFHIQQQLILAQGQLRGDVGPERRSEDAERQN